jgi:nitrous oxidase accessory protein NosD
MSTRIFAARLFGLFALALFASSTAVPCSADVINVAPGVGTLQAAIDAASPGDELRLIDGTYTGAVVVNKSLKIYCYADATSNPCLIDAACGAPIAVDVAADAVSITHKRGFHLVQIIGGTTTELRIANSENVLIYNVFLDQAFQLACGTETTGLEIAASDGVRVQYSDSGHGAYIHDIAPGARVTFKSSQFFNDDLTGASLLIENSSGKVKIQKGSYATGSDGAAPNEICVHLVNSDGVKLQKNTLSTSDSGVTGFLLDATSDGNTLTKNRWADANNGAMPYVNNGTDNCARANFSDPGSTPFPNSCP